VAKQVNVFEIGPCIT